MTNFFFFFFITQIAIAIVISDSYIGVRCRLSTNAQFDVSRISRLKLETIRYCVIDVSKLPCASLLRTLFVAAVSNMRAGFRPSCIESHLRYSRAFFASCSDLYRHRARKHLLSICRFAFALSKSLYRKSGCYYVDNMQ